MEEAPVMVEDAPAKDAEAAAVIDDRPLRDKIEAELRDIYDPEIPVNIFDLGLVYGIKVDDNNNVNITMTLTAPACPSAGEILFTVEEKVKAIADVNDVHVHLTFEPQWTKEMMSEETKLELGFM